MVRKSWIGDWETRIRERTRILGYDTVTAFAAARPRATLFEMVEELGSEDINVAQLIALLRDEAELGNFVDLFLRSQLVHELWQAIPKGWRIDPGDGFEFEFKVASALGRTAAALPESHRAKVTRLARAMLAAELPIGWLPTGPDDPILVGLLESVENKEDS